MEKLLQIVKDINEKTDYCWFFSYSWHTNWISTQITKSKEDFDILYAATIYIWETFWDTYEEVEKQLKNFLPLNIETYEKN